MRRSIRSVSLLLLLSAAAFTLFLLKNSHGISKTLPPIPYGPTEQHVPIVVHPGAHPIHQLIAEAEADFKNVQSRQSKSLSDAVAEYRRRYGIPPPPNFDKWYEFAKKRNVQMIDEYDTIYHSLLPFWGVEPSVLRERVRQAIGFDNAMIAVKIRDGEVVKLDGGGEMYQWHREATPVMLKPFLKYLPDMDLAFNVHDEPRIVLQNDELDRHVQVALDKNIPKVARRPVSDQWSPRPLDVGSSEQIKEYKTTRFNKFAHQPTWSNSRISCPLNSAARSCMNDTCPDNVASYSTLPLGIIQNATAFSDICNSPSLETSFGFFDRPNAFDVAHELIPIFSQSKVSSFQDILYPSPWYYMGKVAYHSMRDHYWGNKDDTMFWRGSTTGGFSRDGGWRRQHRQRFVQKIQPTEITQVLWKDTKTKPGQSLWRAEDVSMQQYNKYFDVKFTMIGQCDPDDCTEQQEEFEVVEPVNMFDALQSKFLLDIDGNAFSGRYYAWLLSNSLVFKLALFREWHDEWIRPWVHYVPLSIKGDEYAEMMRYFAEDETGQTLAHRLAQQGQEWAQKVLRNEDIEVWYFRLLLEYGRVIDDHRDNIGFSL